MIALNDTYELTEQIVVPVWAWLVAALCALAVYVVAVENGAVLAHGATRVHELFHDARHFIGVPCH